MPFSWVDVSWTRGKLGLLSLAKSTLGDGDEGDSLKSFRNWHNVGFRNEIERTQNSSLGSKTEKLLET